MWTAKRARAILARLDGADHDQIAKDLNVSEASVTRWIATTTPGGRQLRAYHTPVSRLAAGDLELERRLTAAVAVAPTATTKHASKNGTDGELDRLLERFGRTQ